MVSRRSSWQTLRAPTPISAASEPSSASCCGAPTGKEWRGAGVAAPASVNGLTFVGWDEPIACGGCAIFPGDTIVCDDDGAVVIPQNLLAFVAEEGPEHELMETYIVSEVEKGAKLPGLYPMNDESKARYEAWKKNRA